MQPQYLVVAHIARAQGLRGEVEIIVLTDYPERFERGKTLRPNPPVARFKELTIDSVQKRPKAYVFKFEEINSREDAEAISGVDLVVPIEDAVELPAGDFWIHDIIGMEVYTVGGEHVGTVQDVLRTGANDVYVVKQAEKEVLIPAIKDVVKSISLEKRQIVIDPIPGMLE